MAIPVAKSVKKDWQTGKKRMLSPETRSDRGQRAVLPRASWERLRTEILGEMDRLCRDGARDRLAATKAGAFSGRGRCKISSLAPLAVRWSASGFTARPPAPRRVLLSVRSVHGRGTIEQFQSFISPAFHVRFSLCQAQSLHHDLPCRTQACSRNYPPQMHSMASPTARESLPSVVSRCQKPLHLLQGQPITV